MPKKTKKAKLIAEYRRKLQCLNDVTSINHKTTPQQPVHSVFTLPVSTPISQATTTTVLFPEEESHAIKKDLIKTLFIVTLFIVFELFLSKILQ